MNQSRTNLRLGVPWRRRRLRKGADPVVLEETVETLSGTSDVLLATGSLHAMRIAPVATALVVAEVASSASALVATKEAWVELTRHIVES